LFAWNRERLFVGLRSSGSRYEEAGFGFPLLEPDIRAAAVEILPKLLNALKEKGEAILKAVANAELLAAKIGKKPGPPIVGRG
jgi:hypothetical protein